MGGNRKNLEYLNECLRGIPELKMVNLVLYDNGFEEKDIKE